MKAEMNPSPLIHRHHKENFACSLSTESADNLPVTFHQFNDRSSKRFSQLWSKEKCRKVIMSKSNKIENKNGTSVEMLDAFKRQHMIVRNFNALTLSRTFSPSLLFLFSTFSFFGIFMFRHFYFRPKLGLPSKQRTIHCKFELPRRLD